MTFLAIPVYLFDAPGAVRRWSQMIGPYKQSCWDGSIRSVVSESGQALRTGVVVVHGSHLVSTMQGAALRQGRGQQPKLRLLDVMLGIVERSARAIYIVISGEEQNEGIVVPNRLYFRRARVNAPDDYAFSVRFRQFMRTLESRGEVRFELLDALMLPIELTAAYLISLAASYQPPADGLGGQDRESSASRGLLSRSDWAAAQRQYRERILRNAGEPAAESHDMKCVASDVWPDTIFARGAPGENVVNALKTALSVSPSMDLLEAGRQEMAVDLHCDASVICGRLKHSWLANQVLNKSRDDIVVTRADGAWEALEVQFPVRIKEALQLADGLVDGFSPAHLVDRLPCFNGLTDRQRDRIKEGVHEAYVFAYVVRNNIAGRTRRVVCAAEALSHALERIRLLWHEGSDNDLRSAWGEVLNVAGNLRWELDTLPRTVMLP